MRRYAEMLPKRLPPNAPCNAPEPYPEHMKKLAALAALPLALTACSSGSGDGASSTSTSASALKLADQQFGSLAAFKDALVKEGYSCPNWSQTNVMISAAESGSCSTDDVLATYASEESKQKGMEDFKSVQADLASLDASSSPDTEDKGVIYGKNWSLNTHDVTKWQEKLGGNIVR